MMFKRLGLHDVIALRASDWTIEREGILFCLDALGSSFLSKFLVKDKVVINDLMIVF